MRGRFLDCTLGNPFLNLALEEALFVLLDVPVLRVWDNQRSIVIGRAQLARTEVDVEGCRQKSVPVVRRFTAGGAVYNGPGNINWSFFVPSKSREAGGARVFDAKRVFSPFAATLAEALERCSACCRYEPPNQIVNDLGKVSGMAAYMASKGVICHGTLLLEADLEEVEALTKLQDIGADKRYVRSRHTRVANCGVQRETFVKALRAVNAEYASGSPRAAELALASRLTAERYSTDRWNLGDPFLLDYL
jgi:lipoate-protein ligase A